MRVDQVDRDEALQQTNGLSMINPELQRGSSRASCVYLDLDEEVFISQLALRASLLNNEFQAEILQIINAYGCSFGHHECDKSNGLPVISMSCIFNEIVGEVEIHPAPPKMRERMRQKMHKYTYPHPRSVWPLCANILDPIRVSIVCHGASQILQILSWFAAQEECNGLPVCRLKNRFSFPEDEVPNGYRDIQICVVFEGSSGLSIIGEIQIHDSELHALKLKVFIHL